MTDEYPFEDQERFTDCLTWYASDDPGDRWEFDLFGSKRDADGFAAAARDHHREAKRRYSVRVFRRSISVANWILTVWAVVQRIHTTLTHDEGEPDEA